MLKIWIDLPNKNGECMKKFLIVIFMFSVLLRGSQGATSSSVEVEMQDFSDDFKRAWDFIERNLDEEEKLRMENLSKKWSKEAGGLQEWHISFDELQRGLSSQPLVGAPSLLRLTVNRIVNDGMCVLIEKLKAESLDMPDELMDMVAQEWYKKNYGQLLNKIDITNIKKQTLDGHNSAVTSVAALPNGDIVTGSNDETAKIWDPNTGRVIKTLTGHNNWVASVAVLANGDIVTGSWDNTVKIWDSATGRVIRTLVGHTGAVTSVAVLPNGDIVMGSADNIIKIWDPNTGQLKQTLIGHNDMVRSVAVLANGDIVTGSNDKTAKIWDLNTGRVIRTLTGHNGMVRSVAVLQNGDIVTGSADNTAIVWKISDAIKKMLEKDGKITLDSLCKAEKELLKEKTAAASSSDVEDMD
jgi:WD40 repeat protein